MTVRLLIIEKPLQYTMIRGTDWEVSELGTAENCQRLIERCGPFITSQNPRRFERSKTSQVAQRSCSVFLDAI